MQHPAPAFVGTNMKMGLQRATGGRGLSASGIQVRQLRSRLTISTLQCSLQCSPTVNTPKVFALAAFEFRRQGKKRGRFNRSKQSTASPSKGTRKGFSSCNVPVSLLFSVSPCSSAVLFRCCSLNQPNLTLTKVGGELPADFMESEFLLLHRYCHINKDRGRSLQL